MEETKRQYIAIDLKSFYASVECVDRGLNPLTTNLVVADVSRTEKTICLAVSPSLKAYGIGGRARLFEVAEKIREIHQKTGKTIEYIAAPPRMARYMQVSADIYKIYLKYIAPEDIHVYSCDEVFMDVTPYLKSYKKTAHDLAMEMIRDVLCQTGITATAGIGTNLYLCKVAMDIVAKHMPADKDGVRIAELDERSYREQLWSHRPLTDFWRVGKGIANRLETYDIHTMGEIARISLTNDEFFYRLFGMNAELLIDHAWGWEPCTLEQVKAYRPTTNSISSGQVLQCPYEIPKARVVVQEMADYLALDLLDKRLVTDQLVLTVGYDMESLRNSTIRAKYNGPTTKDYYGREVPKHAHGTTNLGRQTSSERLIGEAVLDLFDRLVHKDLLVRRLNLTANHVVREEIVVEKTEKKTEQMDLFTDYEAIDRQKREDEKVLLKERSMQETVLRIKKKFGKNAILKGLNFQEGATARQRNEQIGGHKA